ncbi:MAG: DUF1501 domain-containing protein [Armatimonadota bacterium]
MIRVEGRASRVCDGTTRRELLRFGGLGMLGLRGAPALARAAGPRGFGRAKSLLFISLFGGPSHQDMWDLKPDAPSDVRGEFKPIETNVSGIRICEHLPKLARMADRYVLVRSVTHPDNGHGSAMYTNFTGFPHPMPNTNPVPSVDDYPAYGSVISALRPPKVSVPPFIVVGGTQIVCGNQIPGQRAGFLGPALEPFVVEGDPNRPDFRVPELSLPKEIPTLRLDRRRTLLDSVERGARLAERGAPAEALDAIRRGAFELLASRQIREALDLSPEKPELRERFGRDTFGQSLILARRLIEAGVPCVTVNWSRGGPWDTHGNNFAAMKDSLLPPFDRSFSTLLQDLTDRGLLDSTLVIATGEFGRTPKINKDAGRDHWAGVYTTVLAGGGIQGGRVHGTSDAEAAYPASDPVGPADIAATLYHCMGIHPETEVYDRTNRPLKISTGQPIGTIL